jgi:hypothetical protein
VDLVDDHCASRFALAPQDPRPRTAIRPEAALMEVALVDLDHLARDEQGRIELPSRYRRCPLELA